MLKGEIDILSDIALKKCKTKQIISGRAVRNNMYAKSTFDSMVKNGFIQQGKWDEYKLTLKGIQALLKFPKIDEILGKTLRSKLLHQYLENVRSKKQLSGL